MCRIWQGGRCVATGAKIEGPEAGEVQDPAVQPLPQLRPGAGISSEVPTMPYLLSSTEPPGRYPWCAEVELVIVWQ
jgi:hypothetical protein